MKNKSKIFKKSRDELEAISPYPYDNLRPWIAKAAPIIKKLCPNYFSEFRENSSEPQWNRFKRINSGNRLADQCVNLKIGQDEAASNRRKTEIAKQMLLNFLDSILGLETIDNYEQENKENMDIEEEDAKIITLKAIRKLEKEKIRVTP